MPASTTIRRSCVACVMGVSVLPGIRNPMVGARRRGAYLQSFLKVIPFFADSMQALPARLWAAAAARSMGFRLAGLPCIGNIAADMA